MGRQEIRVVLINSGSRGEFTTKLVKPLTLSKNWRVAITELSISSLPKNFGPHENFTCECYNQNGTRKSETFHINDRIVDSGKNLITMMRLLGEKSEVFSQTITILRWNSINKKVEFKL